MRQHGQTIASSLIAALALFAPARHAGAAGLTAPSPRQNSPQSTAPTIQVYSRETVVDVIVTDAEGHPVRNLKQSDFTVKEDGKEQPIRSFKETGSVVPVAVQAMPRKLPAGVYTNLQASPTSGPVNIVLLDIFHTTPKDAVYMKKATIDYLKSMPQGTEVAIFAWSVNKGFRLLQEFTSDGLAAAAKVDALDVEWLKQPVPKVGPLIATDAVSDVMNHIAAYASGIKGRKSLMWFAGPVPISCNATDQSLAVLFDSLMAAQIAVYPLDARGLFNIPAFVGPGPAAAAFQGQFLRDTGCHQLAMEAVAEATGGVAYYNNNDLQSEIAKVVDYGNHYYTLTYVPPPFANDARYHPIHIEVNRPGLHLTYRKGFAAEDPMKPPPTSGPQLMRASMGRGVPPSTQLLFDVKVAPSTEPENPFDPPVMGLLNAKFKKSPLARYSFLFAVPASQITFADTLEGNHNGSLEFDVAAYDPDGNLATLRSQTMHLPLTPDEYFQFMQTPFQFLQQLDLPPGQFTLRIGILDGVSNKVGTLEIPLNIAGTRPQRAATHAAPANRPR
jgi:VWFA-related protein